MLKNYFTVAIRNLLRHKLFSVINMLGLSVGISASLVIFLIVQYDYSFDRFEKDGDRIYRVVSDYQFQGGTPGHTRGVQGPLAEAVRKGITGIDETVSFRYYNVGKLAIPAPGQTKPAVFKSPDNIIFADGSYFNLLPYRWLAGSPAAMGKPRQVVLSETRAKQYFPSMPYANLLGRTIFYDDTVSAQVAGIVQDLDQQGKTDFSFREFISLATILDNAGLRNSFYWDKWGSTTSDQQLYVHLSKGSVAATVEAALKRLAAKQFTDGTWQYALQPLSDIHFNNHYGVFKGNLANKNTLRGLILVAVFLLLLGSINFINLTTAQAVQRAKEIGIRKTIGSSRWQLIVQFLSETFVVTLMAMILSILLIPLLLNVFTDFIPEGLHFSLAQPALILFLVLLVLVVSLLAGIYPAMALSSWNALSVLKNQAHAGSSGTRRVWVRQSLTVAQFVIAQFFVIGMALVSKQIRFMMDKDLGFNKEAILSVGTPRSDTSLIHRQYVLDEIRKIGGVAMVSLGNDVPSSGDWWTSGMEYKEGNKDIKTIAELKSGDANYLRLFHIPLVSGREPLPSDTLREIVINETYVRELGFKQPSAALGKMLDWGNNVLTPVVGVMKDFNAHSLNYRIAPMIFFQQASNNHDLIVALQPGQPPVAEIEKVFKKAWPEEDFGYTFLDESIASAYGTERNISKLLKWATGLTIFISCLGLLGLVIYITNQRAKEIGVRKVLGASVGHIVYLLSKDFLRLVALAFLIAMPLAWWAINNWLENYVFRTTVSWWVFVASGLGMMLLSLMTLSIQTLRTAMTNPVKSLKTE